MENPPPSELAHHLEVNPDVVKVIGFMRHNVEYDALLDVARWVAEIAPLVWPDAAKKNGLRRVPAPIDYTWTAPVIQERK